MSIHNFTHIRLTIIWFFFALLTGVILVSCSPNPNPPAGVTQDVSPSASSPAGAQPSLSTQAVVATLASTPAQPVINPTPAGGTVSSINACGLITKDEAEAAFGGPVADGVREDYPPIYSCRFYGDNLNYVGVTVVEFADADQANAAFQSEIDINGYPEVSGIGDRALRPAIFDIDVLQGKYELSVNLVNDDDDETRFEKSKILAAIALSRLP